MQGKLIVPIKAILTGNASIQQIEEFEFVRNNPIASVAGAGALGVAAAHDYHTNGYHSVGKYIGDKIDTVKNAVGSGIDATRKGINSATSENSGMSNTIDKVRDSVNNIKSSLPSPALHTDHFTNTEV